MPERNNFLLFFLVLFTFSCAQNDNTSENESSTHDSLKVWDGIDIVPKISNENMITQYFDEVRELCISWNKAIDERDFGILTKLYSDEVEMYGQNLSADGAIEGKRSWLEKHPDYHQELKTISLDCYYQGEDFQGELFANFKKVTHENGKEEEYDQVLKFKLIHNEWKIVRETDLVTEVNLAKKERGIQLKDGAYCFETLNFHDVRDEGIDRDIAYSENTLNFVIRNGNLVSGDHFHYGGSTHMHFEFILSKGSQDENNNLHMEFQRIDTDSGEVGEELQKLEVKVVDEEKIVVLNSKVFFQPGESLSRIKCPE